MDDFALARRWLELFPPIDLDMYALAEIFELRPESLETEGLVTALTKQTAALRARYQIEITMDVGREPDVSLEVKEALYRIAQESMHNTVKHAQASAISVRLTCSAEGIVLEVADNGQGFDPSGSFPGHLGLQSMRERCTRLGDHVAIESVPGHGTQVRTSIPFTESSYLRRPA